MSPVFRRFVVVACAIVSVDSQALEFGVYNGKGMVI